MYKDILAHTIKGKGVQCCLDPLQKLHAGLEHEGEQIIEFLSQR